MTVGPTLLFKQEIALQKVRRYAAVCHGTAEYYDSADTVDY